MTETTFDGEFERGDYYVGDGYRVWLRRYDKRYSLVISRGLLAKLAGSDDPESALTTHEDVILRYANQMILDGSTEPHDGYRFLTMAAHQAEAIWRLQ